MHPRRVVITGLGALTPLGNNVATYWKNLLEGVSGGGPITKFDARLHKVRFACEVKGFQPDEFFDRKEQKKLDPYTQYALVAAQEAILDAGLDLEKVASERIGVVWGTGVGGIKSMEDEVTAFARSNGIPRVNPFFVPRMIADIAAGHIAIKYRFRGPNYSTLSACASSANAIVDAFNLIQLGYAEAMVTGGSEAPITHITLGGFSAMRALSERNEDPATASRPFDRDRDGFVIGEGGGALILETYEHAKARGARVYAELVGCGLSADAYHMTGPDPEGRGVVAAMRNAVQGAGIPPQEVDYVNAHATATSLGDVAEAKAIQTFFGEEVANVNVSATKSMTGHLLGAAGAIEAIATVLSIKDQIVPPTINHFTEDPALAMSINFTFNKSQKRSVSFAISNNFGFGGHNCAILFRKMEV